MNDAQSEQRAGGNRRRRRRRGRRDNGNTQGEIDWAQVEEMLTVPADRTLVIGLTGEPGAGKSALAAEFARLGAEVIDVDAAGHEAIEGPATKKKLVDTFGDGILAEDGRIDRAALAKAAFVDAEHTARLNKIVHPRLTTKVKGMLKKAGNFVVLDAALLGELGLDHLADQTVYVRAPRPLRLQRLAERGWDEAELARREAALGDGEERRKRCQLTVENSAERKLLTTYARTILARLLGVDLSQARRAPGGDNDGDNGNGNGGGGSAQQPREAEREPVTVELDRYLERLLPDLQREAEELEVRDVRALSKEDLICEILRRVAGNRQDQIQVSGFVEIASKGQSAHIRSPLCHYAANSTDTFITGQQLRRFGLKPGMHLVGTARAPRGNEKCPQLLGVNTVMGEDVAQRSRVREFRSLTPLHATDRLFMELPNDPTDYSLRIIDLVAPIGKGQRGLIVAQPKCGKTVYLQKIANAITGNNPDVTLMVLLIDERPEEVTDMERSVTGEVISSTFDQPASRHVQVAETAINKAKRLVELGQDVVILLDSITRLARAYNTEAPNSGRIMSGGIESTALIKPKQFFGAARNIEEGGSLTILATALVDTGSVMDTVIFEEFKGTGNMELVLDRRLANKRIFPAVDVAQSGTRKDDLLVKDPEEMKRLWTLRRYLSDRSSQDAIDFLKGRLRTYKTNIEFLMTIDPDKNVI